MNLRNTVFSFLLLLGIVASKEVPAEQAFRIVGPEGYANSLSQLIFPEPADPNYLVALNGDSGVWVSRDGGASWRSLTDNSGFSGTFFNLAIDPHDHSHWLVSGYKDGDRGFPTLLATRDAGKTWTLKVTSNGVGTHLFDNEVPGFVVASYSPFAFYSLDGGQTWIDLPFGIQPLLLRRGKIYVKGNRSIDIFDPIHQTQEQISTEPLSFLLRRFWADLTRENTFFATDQAFDKLYRSTDGGRTFQFLSLGARYGFVQSPWNPSHLAILDSDGLRLSLDRGESWALESAANLVRSPAAAFDPTNGELLLQLDDALVRRRLDGSRASTRPRGLYATLYQDIFFDQPRDQFYALGSQGTILRSKIGKWRWEKVGKAECLNPGSVVVAPWNSQRIFVACNGEYLTSADGGLTFSSTPRSSGHRNPVLFSPGEPGSTWVLNDNKLSSIDRDPQVERQYIESVVFDPDPNEGLIASSLTEKILQWKPASGWQTLAQNPPFEILAQAPSNPSILIGARPFDSGVKMQVSNDRGLTWNYLPATGLSYSDFDFDQIVIDPRNPDHLVLGGSIPPYVYIAYESFDGGHQFEVLDNCNAAVQMDPDSNLYLANCASIQQRPSSFEDCSEADDNFCARDGRFELTVEWTTPNGQSGVAKKVATGSEESGLFYFFDENNWELLVKVLDGCAYNDRFWVFTAGTTNVEYLLKVEDRYSGKIRTYFNQAGKAAEATTDTDAFATCGTLAPGDIQPAKLASPAQIGTALKAEAPAPLELVNGRFEVSATWTNFEGQTGFGTPTPLRSANSGLFWFFSPDNWEVLLKVLDGCAINGHYWVLAAATTNVGYELTVNEPGTESTRTYSNPVGKPSPAQIDLEAFACPAL